MKGKIYLWTLVALVEFYVELIIFYCEIKMIETISQEFALIHLNIATLLEHWAVVDVEVALVEFLVESFLLPLLFYCDYFVNYCEIVR